MPMACVIDEAESPGTPWWTKVNLDGDGDAMHGCFFNLVNVGEVPHSPLECLFGLRSILSDRRLRSNKKACSFWFLVVARAMW